MDRYHCLSLVQDAGTVVVCVAQVRRFPVRRAAVTGMIVVDSQASSTLRRVGPGFVLLKCEQSTQIY